MKSRLLAAVAVAAIAAPGIANAQAWYGRVGVGYGTTQNIDIQDVGGTGVAPSLAGKYPVQSEGHILPDLAIGYETGSGLRFEVEGSYQFDDTGAVGNLPFSDSDVQTYALLGNVIYDFGGADLMGSGVSPFLGAGVGFARQALSAIAPTITAPGTFGGPAYVVDDEDWSPVAQFIAGVRVHTGSNLSTELRYRFMSAFEGTDYDDALGGEVTMDYFASHDIIASLIWSFGEPEAPPPPPPPPPPAPPPPPPPPPPAPACENVEFVVYFEWDKSDITDQARSVIQMAANRAQECGVASVQIDGHADRSGSASYNVGLSQRRADAVSATLVSMGVPAASISTQAFGESQPAVETPDGVREPLNRRSEVIIRVNGARS